MQPFHSVARFFTILSGCIYIYDGQTQARSSKKQKKSKSKAGPTMQVYKLYINHSSNQYTSTGDSTVSVSGPQIAELNTSESLSREGSMSSLNGHFRRVQGGAVQIQGNSSNSHTSQYKDENSVVGQNMAPVLNFTHINVNRDIIPILGSASCIGTGGFAIVYKSTYRGLPVAVKHFRMEHQIPLTNQEKDDAFLKELSIITQLDHKNLVKCYGACVEPGSRAIVMEYVGWSLYDRLELFKKFNAKNNTNRRMCLANILKIVRSIAEGLHYLHSKNIVHRDLHPQNVLIDNNGYVKITDMGISKMLQHTISVDSKRGGIEYYLAPEIFENIVCCKSDIYSLGIIANQLWSLCDSWNVSGHGIYYNCERIIAGERPSIAADTPQFLKDLIIACLQKDFNERPTALEIVHDCEIELDYLRQQQNAN